MPKEYYFIDIDLTSMQIINWGITKTANLTGATGNPSVHRVYLTRGQYNKLEQLLKKKLYAYPVLRNFTLKID